MSGKIGDDITLDMIASNIDEIITSMDEIISDLEGEQGIMMLDKSKSLIQKGMSGKYKTALENSLIDVEMSYMHSVANVKALRAVLREYRFVINHGASNLLVKNGDALKVNMSEIYTQISNLRDTIEEQKLLTNILKNDEDFDCWLSAYTISLDDSLLHTYTVDSEGNMIDDGIFAQKSKKEKVFKENATVLSELDTSLATSFTKTSSIVEALEATSGILGGELAGLEDIWDVFEFTLSDYQNYLVAKRDLNVQRPALAGVIGLGGILAEDAIGGIELAAAGADVLGTVAADVGTGGAAIPVDTITIPIAIALAADALGRLGGGGPSGVEQMNYYQYKLMLEGALEGALTPDELCEFLSITYNIQQNYASVKEYMEEMGETDEELEHVAVDIDMILAKNEGLINDWGDSCSNLIGDVLINDSLDSWDGLNDGK